MTLRREWHKGDKFEMFALALNIETSQIIGAVVEPATDYVTVYFSTETYGEPDCWKAVLARETGEVRSREKVEASFESLVHVLAGGDA